MSAMLYRCLGERRPALCSEMPSVDKMIPYDLRVYHEPSPRNKLLNPITGDFAFMENPKGIAHLGVKIGRVGFAPVCQECGGDCGS